MPRSYAFNLGLSWPDFLKVNEIRGVGDDVRQLRFEVSSSNRQLIATYEELQRENIATAGSIRDAVSSGFERLAFDMRAISGGIAELSAAFEWGLSELLAGVGHLNDTLKELVKIAKTPTQTWAYEQFEIARDGFRQGLYEEALEYLNRAIEGYGDNTGYTLEYRFHFLLGTIRLGSFKNNSPSIVDPVKAEQAFLAAAKYARHDLPQEAGRAFLAAGWAAYCQGRIPEAEKHTEEAISLYPSLGEAHFQKAKIMMHRGAPDGALPLLRKAAALDRNYLIKASSDDDFRRYEQQVNRLIQKMHVETREQSESTLADLEKHASQLEKSRVMEFSTSKYSDLSPLRDRIVNAKKAAGNNTLFGFLDALAYCNQARGILSKTREAFFNSATRDVRSKLADIDAKIGAVKKAGIRAVGGWLIAVGVILSLVVSTRQCSTMMDANERQARVRQQAFDRMHADLKSKGHKNSENLTWDQVRPYGYSKEKMPPAKVGSTFNTWLLYLLGGLAISAIVGHLASAARKLSEMADLKSERSRLKKIDGELGALQTNT